MTRMPVPLDQSAKDSDLTITTANGQPRLVHFRLSTDTAFTWALRRNLFTAILSALLVQSALDDIGATASQPGGCNLNVASLPTGVAVDSSPDAWATTLSDIGPLILLIGQRSTKQLLCNVHGLSHAFSLATAPLGLVSIVSSLVRLAGSHRLRSFLGYELESRSVAAMQLTRINCNGVHAELVDGYLVRSTAALSESNVGVIGVLTINGSLKGCAAGVVKQIHSCRLFERRKSNLGLPEMDAALRWCSQIKMRWCDEVPLQDAVEVLAAALGVDASEGILNAIREFWKGCYPTIGQGHEDKCEAEGDEEHMPCTKSEKHKIETHEPMHMKEDGNISFLCTFDAISEFCTATAMSRFTSASIGVAGFLIIISLYVLELATECKWQPTVGYLLAIFGYVGIVICVVASALHIHSTTHSIPLQTHIPPAAQSWHNGIVIAATSDSKAGAALHQTAVYQWPLAFEAVWLKPLLRRDRALANCIALVLTLSFLCHYMGLRSSSRWLGASELAVCIVMAFLRSLNKGGPEKFVISDNGEPRLDWHCCSTGVITVNDPVILPPGSKPTFGGLDARAYSEASAIGPPVPAEKLAWRLAGLCIGNKKVMNWLRDLTGMYVYVSSESDDKRALLVCYKGGVLVKEGAATPNTAICVAFRSTIESLATPTGLLLRGIMRQPCWSVAQVLGETVTTLGNVHVPALQSLVTWWTLCELRNTIVDNQENLQWAALPLLTSFFAFIRTHLVNDRRLVDGLAAVHEGRGEDVQDLAEKLYECWKRESDPELS